MKKSLVAKRLAVFASGVVVTCLVMVMLVQVFTLIHLRQTHRESLETSLQSRTDALAHQMAERMEETKHAIDAVAERVRNQSPQFDAAFEALLREGLEEHPELYGLIVGFLPEASPRKGALYAPYLIRRNGRFEFKRVEDSYDYNQPEHAWFSMPLREGSYMTKLYYGHSAKDWMVTYARRLELPDAQGIPQTAGVVGAEYSLSRLWTFFRPGSIAGDGYAFLIDRDGDFLAHPDSRLTAEGKKLADLLHDQGTDERTRILEAVNDLKAVRFSIDSEGQKAWARIAPVPGTDWLVCQVIVPYPWGDTRDQILKSGIRLTLTLTLLAWFCAFFYAAARPSGSICWRRLTLIVSIVALGSTVCIWWMNTQMGQYRDISSAILGLDTALEAVVEADLSKTAKEHRPTPIIAQVGVVLRAIQKAGADQFKVSGILWQRLPRDRPEDLPTGVFLPDAESSEFVEQYRYIDGNHDVIGWKFSALLRQRFDNRHYPFDRLSLRLRMRQSSLSHPVLIVPDLGAYRMGIPAAKPYVADNTTLPGWVIERTFFTMSAHTYDTDFGLRNQSSMDDIARSCTLNVIVRREWLSSLMGVLLPVFIIIAVSFAAIRMISSNRDFVVINDFKPQRMVMLASSFCLFLVLVSAGLRTQLSSSGVFYAEWLFFMLYLLLGANCWLGTAIACGKGFLSRNDGKVIKRGYWPVVLTAVYLITFFMFHHGL